MDYELRIDKHHMDMLEASIVVPCFNSVFVSLE